MAKFLSPGYQSPKIVKINGINLGTGEGIFFGTSGNSLEFKSLIAGTNVSLVATDNDITINASFTDATTASNLGTGDGLFASEVGDDLQFKSLKAGSNITITPSSTELLISGSAPEATTASNLGTGAGVFESEVSNDLRFKSLVAGAGIDITPSGTELLIESTASGAGEANTSSSLGAGVSFVAPKSGVNLPFRSLLSSAGLTWSQQTDTVTIDLQAGLISIAGLTTSANKGIYTTASNTYATYDLSVFGKSLIDDADAPAARTTLGLGTSATRDATTSATDTTSERLWRTNDLVKTTSNTDSTAGSILRVGDWGLGAAASILVTNLNTLTNTGFYAAATTATGHPNGSETIMLSHQQGISGINRGCQRAIGLATGNSYSRKQLDGVWSSWVTDWNSGNFDPTTKADLAGSTFTGAVAFSGTSTFSNVTINGSTSLIGVMSFEADNYGGGWARGMDFMDGGTRVVGMGGFGAAGTVTYLYIGAGSSPWAGTHRIEVRTTGISFFGTLTVPTPAAGTSTTQIANTEFAASKTKVVTTRSATSYTFALADNIDIYNRFTNAGASTCTVPPNSSVAYPVGHVISIRRAASANLTLTPGSGVTLNAPSGGTLVMTNNMTVELIKVATNEWDVVGQTVPI